jgi:hypothetical protein
MPGTSTYWGPLVPDLHFAAIHITPQRSLLTGMDTAR